MRRELTDFELESYEASDDSEPLDLLSTSPTRFQDLGFSFHRCRYNAPYFAIRKSDNRYRVIQGCCNHWDCPRCGIMVAKKHYGNIVTGARKVNETCDLWFVTVTCRGKELTVEDAKANYLAWTSKFLDACYSKTRRDEGEWFYVQVTELQRRGHPHSHILTSFSSSDYYYANVDDWKRGNDGVLRNVPVRKLRSDWISAQVIRSGLGTEYDISRVKTVEACSRYIAKYMFKPAQFRADFPPRWKRVRYSQSWPRLEKKRSDAFVILGASDWIALIEDARVLDCEEGDAFEQASHYNKEYGIVLHEVKQGDKTTWQSELASTDTSSMMSNSG